MTREPYETIKRGPFRIEVFADDAAGQVHPRRDPRTPASLFLTWTRRYNSPDPVPSWASPGEDLEADAREHLSDVRMVLPVYKYEHGAVCYRLEPFSCPWDSGQAGVIIAHGDAFKELSDEQVIAWLRAEVDEYSSWANGEVYGYVVSRGEEEVDSCWGFIGDPHAPGGCIDQALDNVRPATDEDGS